MPHGPPLSPEELVRLRRAVGLPDTLPHEEPDAPVAEGTPRCECGCGGRPARRLPGHEPRGTIHRRKRS
jgi:hypothetical protein